MTTPATDRVDIFSLIHKGIRRTLFDTALAVGRTDFTRDEDIASARAAVARCFDFLREHAEHEDRHWAPNTSSWKRGSSPSRRCWPGCRRRRPAIARPWGERSSAA